MAQDKLHTIKNKVTALQSQLYLLKKNNTPVNSNVQRYIIKMETTLEELKDELTGLQNISKTTD